MVMLPYINYTFIRNFLVSLLLINLGSPRGSSISFTFRAVERLC